MRAAVSAAGCTPSLDPAATGMMLLARPDPVLRLQRVHRNFAVVLEAHVPLILHPELLRHTHRRDVPGVDHGDDAGELVLLKTESDRFAGGFRREAYPPMVPVDQVCELGILRALDLL